MTRVVIAGIGQTPVGEHWEAGLRDLALHAMREAISDSGGLCPKMLVVGNMLAANLSNQAHLGVLLADYAHLPGIEAVSVEAAGASGGAALRQGYLAVASGMVDAALVVGVEKLTDRPAPEVDSAMTTTSDSDFEAVHGQTPAAQAAMLMQRYLHEYAVPADGLASFAIAAHANGEGNPNAMFRKSITPEIYSGAAVINEPLRQFDVAPYADGAAAVMLARRELLPERTRFPLVRVAGSGSAVDTLSLHDRENVLGFRSCRVSAEKALAQADTRLDELDFLEYHDAFGIYAVLSMESMGFAEPGLGWKLASDGGIGREGRIPSATMGGLKARGFPGGATGVYQAVEATLQLQGRAGANQLTNPACGLIQSMGGPASTVITHVLALEP